MSLLQLLTAGKSLMGLSKASSRFEVTKQRLLPKFESGKNPFRATTLPQLEAEDVPLRSATAAPEPERPAEPADAPLHASVFSANGAPASAPPGGRAGSLCGCGRESGAGGPLGPRPRDPSPARCNQSCPWISSRWSETICGTPTSRRLVAAAWAERPRAHGKKGAGAMRAIEKSARELLGACKL